MTILGSAEALWTDETIDGDGHQNYKSQYRIKSDNPMENPITVREAVGVPDYGDQYSWGGVTNDDAFCDHKHTKFEKIDQTFRWWVVETNHSTKPGTSERTSGGLRTNPITDNRWKIGGSYAQGTRIAHRNKNDNWLINVAHEHMTYEVPGGFDTLTMEGPTQYISLPTRAQVVFHVNSAAIWDLPARSILVQQWQYDILFHGSMAYVYHRMQFLINYELWNEYSFEMGTREYISTNVEGKRYMPIIAPNDTGSSMYYLTNNLTNPSHTSRGRRLSDVDVAALNFAPRTEEIIKEYNLNLLGFPDPLPGPFIP